jgi:hypothetical protein
VTVNPSEDESVLNALQQPQPYDPDADEAFELTRRLLTDVLGLYSARRWQLEHDQSVDGAALDELIAAQMRSAHLLQTLDPADRARVEQIRADCVAVLRQEGR